MKSMSMFKAYNYEEMKKMAIPTIEWYAQTVSKILEIDFHESLASINKFRPLIQEKDVYVAKYFASKLCDWLLSKRADNKWNLYTCFKYHLAGDWIDTEIYNEIIKTAADRLT